MAIYGKNPVYSHLEWPESYHYYKFEKGSHAVYNTYFDSVMTILICHIVHLMNLEVIKDKPYKSFAKDLHQVYNEHITEVTALGITDLSTYGSFYPEMV